MEQTTNSSETQVDSLLRIAKYLAKPQKFMAVADARAEMRRTLVLAAQSSVVLTSHGEPEAAVVAFATLEDMRRILMHLLVAEMEKSFARAQERARSSVGEGPTPTEREVEAMIGEVLHKARRQDRKSARRILRS